jgi:hypothetical protein
MLCNTKVAFVPHWLRLLGGSKGSMWEYKISIHDINERLTVGTSTARPGEPAPVVRNRSKLLNGQCRLDLIAAPAQRQPSAHATKRRGCEGLSLRMVLPLTSIRMGQKGKRNGSPQLAAAQAEEGG